jgi:hypothetical protein
MKKSAAIALVVLTAGCTAGLQAQNHEVRADVPFNFAVGNEQLPAGHYTFLTQASYTLVIRNADYQLTILSRTEDAGSVRGMPTNWYSTSTATTISYGRSAAL